MAASIPSAEVRTMRRELVSAADEHVRRVVAMVDALPARGDADALIAPLRNRLATLRPARPINFARLLFMPLDPVIVPGPAWRRGSAAIPRTALAVMAVWLRQTWPKVREVDAALAGATTHHPDRISELGRGVWAEAAPRLKASPPPADWGSVTGLTAADHTAIALAAATVLSQAELIDGLVNDPSPDENRHDATLVGLIEAATAFCGSQPGPLATLAGVLLSRLPRADRVLSRLGTAAGEQGVTFVLDAVTTTALADDTLGGAAEEARRLALMLGDLQKSARIDPSQKVRLEEVRREVDTACRTRFSAAMGEFLATARAGAAQAGAAASVAETEDVARKLKRMERAARQVGGTEFYDRELKKLQQTLAQPETGSRVSRARLAEILLGPDQAAALLAG